ncbi:SAM-dependent methyltransferase [Enterococcus sp. LJL99]
MITYEVKPIGKIITNERGCSIKLDSEFIPALKELNGFSHLQTIWWFSDFEANHFRKNLITEQPYKSSPKEMGIFATRSPIRPNPLALTVVEVIEIDYAKGIIYIPYTDANNGTPILDIKPYTPSLDKVENVKVPTWCNHWPHNLEESANFAWENEFNY